MIVEKFKAEHLDSFIVQEAQREILTMIDSPEYRESLEALDSWSGIVNGETIACGGLLPAGHKALAWMLISQNAGPHMVKIIRKLKKALEDSNYERVEMVIDHGFKEGFRMAEILGFKRETKKSGMKNYHANGKKAHLFARL